MIVTKDIILMALIVTELRYQERPVKLQTIAEKNNVSIHFLEQLARKMRINRLVDSHRGPGGGYTLTIEGKGATLADLYLAKHGYGALNSLNKLDRRILDALEGVQV